MSAAVESLNRDVAPQTSVSQRIASFAAEFAIDSVPSAVVDYAKLCIADSIGIAYASHRYPFAKRSVESIADLAGEGQYPVIGTSLRLPIRDAALLNGILVHGLDFDDTHSGAVIHCSTSAVPLVLGEATRRGATGKEALAAYLLAVETDARIGLPAQGMLQKTGFHPTGLVGIFGCTVASAYLSGLTQEQTTVAQGVALSMASGSLEFLQDGTWTKRMHPGWAASSAITATALARGGFRAPKEAYEGRYGLYNIYLQGNSIETDQIAVDLGSNWETMKVAIKPYPVCHFNHSSIDSILALRKKHKLTADNIKSITVKIHEKQHDVVCVPEASKRRPSNDYDAKFSVQFAVAAALIRGRFTLAELEDDALQDSEILALCDRISYEHDPESKYPEFYSGCVTVETTGGDIFEHRELINRGAEGRALSAEDVRRKFDANVEQLLNPEQAEKLWNAIDSLNTATDLRDLNQALALP